MTIKELKELINEQPDDYEVRFWLESKSGYLNSSIPQNRKPYIFIDGRTNPRVYLYLE